MELIKYLKIKQRWNRDKADTKQRRNREGMCTGYQCTSFSFFNLYRQHENDNMRYTNSL